jgi:PIN domain nuclease of toxin-antitoxin system
MKLLLDTHIFVWYIDADPQLPADVLAAIQDPANEGYLSVASIWEAVIKYNLGKLPLAEPPAEYFPRLREAHRIASLPIKEAVLVELAKLPNLHRDPFDRILIAQAIHHGLTLVTMDHAVRAYTVPLLPPP